MTDTIVYINDQRIDYRRATVSVFDYTLHCGIGLFESILAVDDRPIYLEEHLDRMESGLNRLGLKLNYNRRRMSQVLKKAVKDHPAGIKKAKVFLTAGYSPLWPGTKPQPKTITIVTGHRLEFRKQKLAISPMVISSADPMRGIKSLNFMTEWMSQQKAKASGYDQGIIVNQNGRIAETGSANLFMVKKGRLYTPPLTSGGLPGIIRGEIIRLAKANKISCYEKQLTPENLVTADEIFTTSSFKLVWPVVKVKLDKVYNFQPGPVSRALFERLKSNFLSGNFQDNLNIPS